MYLGRGSSVGVWDKECIGDTLTHARTQDCGLHVMLAGLRDDIRDSRQRLLQNFSNGNYTEKWFGAAEVWTSGSGNLVWSWHNMLPCSHSLTSLSLSFLFCKMGIFIVGRLRKLNGKEYLNVLSIDSCSANTSSHIYW